MQHQKNFTFIFLIIWIRRREEMAMVKGINKNNIPISSVIAVPQPMLHLSGFQELQHCTEHKKSDQIRSKSRSKQREIEREMENSTINREPGANLLVDIHLQRFANFRHESAN